MNKSGYGLAYRIALPFAILLALTMGGLTVYLSSHIQAAFRVILETNLISETRLVADRMSVLMQAGAPTGTLNERASLYAGLLDARVTIIDVNGTVLGESHTVTGEMENHIDRPEVQQALSNQVATELRYSSTLQTDMLYAAAPIIDNGRIIGVARLAKSMRSIRQDQAGLLRTVVLASGVATVVAILLAVVVASLTVRPLKKLTDAADRIASGNFDDVQSVHRDDEIGLLYTSFQNMSAQIQRQINALQTERSKLEVILANMTDGILMVDSSGNVQLINPAALRLFKVLSEKDAIGKSLIEVVRHHQLVDLWKTSLRLGEQQMATLETSPDRLFLQGIATPLQPSLPGMTLLVFQDLTRVRKLETVRRDFISNVSHELRTPLASLKALAETLQESALEDPPAARRFLSRMETEIDNLTQMVRELLELSRIESNRFPLHLVMIDPCMLAAQAVERMRLQAERSRLILTFLCPPDLPAVKADPERIEQVFVNLIHNAMKFTSPGGTITITARSDSGSIVYCVQDTGVGISPDAMPRIFERFYKADQSRSGGGTGLGLSIARHIVEAHGGKIWAESIENAGSKFYFSLPLS